MPGATLDGIEPVNHTRIAQRQSGWQILPPPLLRAEPTNCVERCVYGTTNETAGSVCCVTTSGPFKGSVSVALRSGARLRQ